MITRVVATLPPVFLLPILISTASAQVQRTFVSGLGSDSNTCSRTTPCRTFGQAISQTIAGGEVIVLDSAGYGAVTITRSISIIAPPGVYAGISVFSGDGISINAGASDTVVLRGINLNGTSTSNDGIEAIRVGSLYVDRCSISGFQAEGISLLNGGNLFLTDTDIRGCSDGVIVETNATPAKLVAHDSRFTECFTGVFLAATGAGSATGWLTDCTASLCHGQGFFADSLGSPADADLTLTNCRTIGNGTGIMAVANSTGNAIVRITGCVVTKNSTGIFTFASGFGEPAAVVIGTNPGTNLVFGNTTDGLVAASATLH
jgi:hypothetical protein